MLPWVTWTLQQWARLWPLAGRYIHCRARPYLNIDELLIWEARELSPQGRCWQLLTSPGTPPTLRQTSGRTGRQNRAWNSKCNSIKSTMREKKGTYSLCFDWIGNQISLRVLCLPSIFPLVCFQHIYTLCTEVCCVYNNTQVRIHSAAKECVESLYIINRSEI